ncbi:unnamed protein product [Nippostrongylus brasiliensis]|uniref:ZnMc domain-containing protein n=1 Tax=Nippostrongylus brasiliensis TaxID=27835 RepID=A0A0N4YAF8_NIPBR|nr:unnamed protein product [Nippostrongylus brasiliensis]
MNLTRTLIWAGLVLMCAHGALSLSAKARESLKEALGDVDLEGIRERLRNIARPTLIKLNATATETTGTTNEDVESAVDVLAAADSSISGINKAEGVDEYLYEGDVHLNEKQLSALEAAAAGNGGRRKRSFYADADRWTNNELFYYFDASIGDVMKTRVKTALNYIQARSCVKFTEDATAKAVVKVYSGSGCSSGTGMWPAGQSLSLSPGCGLAAQQSNYDKMETTNEIDYVPYEYGSVMHYDAKSICCPGQINKVLVSNISPTPVVGHSRLSAPTFTYKYRYV